MATMIPGTPINADHIKELKRATYGNFQTDSCTKIIFKDGSTMKVIDSVEEITAEINGKRS